MKYMRFFALAVALFASSSLLAVVFPSYVAKPLADLKISPKTEVHNGIAIAAKYLDKSDLTKLFGSHADTLTKKFRIIQCTVENDTDKDFRIVGNHIEGLNLVKASDVAAVLNPMSLTRLAATTGLTMAGTYINYLVGFLGFFEEDIFSIWGKYQYTLPEKMKITALMGPAFTGIMLLNPKLTISEFGKTKPREAVAALATEVVIPLTIWTTAAISLYKSFKTNQLIKQDLTSKILSSGDPKFHFEVIQPHQTKSFLLVSPIELPAAKQITIAGMPVLVD